MLIFFFFFFKQKTAYEMRISDWSSDVCSSDLVHPPGGSVPAGGDKPAVRRRHRPRARAGRFPRPPPGRRTRRPPPGFRRCSSSDVRFRNRPFRPHFREYDRCSGRSEEHKSELQSLMRISYEAFCFTKKNKTDNLTHKNESNTEMNLKNVS